MINLDSFTNKDEILKSNIDNNLLIKGEGARGGKIIGHTQSGKPVYESSRKNHDKYKDFTKDDHKDAALMHIFRHSTQKVNSEHYKSFGKLSGKYLHDDKIKEHEKRAELHEDGHDFHYEKSK